MSLSLAEFYDDYLESLQNLPSEIDQDMHELRCLDEEFQQLREGYKEKRRLYMKQVKATMTSINKEGSSKSDGAHNDVATSITRTPIPYSMLQNSYNEALEKQDQKLELAMRMYDLVSQHIEKLDTEAMKCDATWNIPKLKQQKAMSATAPAGSIRKRKFSPPGFIPTSATSARRKRPHLYKNESMNGNNITSSSNSSSAILEGYDMNEPLYCYCKQVSFGNMIACDGPNCEKEWFHYSCVGLVEPPEGKWFCNGCRVEDNAIYADNYE